jgi:hypothetical protein
MSLLLGTLCRSSHHTEQRPWQWVERALVDRLRDRAHRELATKDRLNLLRRKAVWPLCSRLQVAKALQKEEPAGREQASNHGDVLRPPLGWQHVKAAPVEDQIERPGQSGGQNIVLLPGDAQSLCLGLLARKADGSRRLIDTPRTPTDRRRVLP